MKATILLMLLVCAFLGVTAFAQAPTIVTTPSQLASPRKDDLQNFTVERLFTTRLIGGSSWAPDGKQVAFIANISGRNNLWVVPATGGWPVQLTVSDQRQASPAWSPNGKWIAYTSDKDGNGQWDVFVVSLATAEVLNLSNTPAISEESPAWSPDSRYLAWQAKPQTSSTYEIELFDMLFRRRRALTSNTPKDFGNFHPVWSHDGKWIAYTQIRADRREASVHVLEVATGKDANLTPHDSERWDAVAAWSPGDKKLLITSDALKGFRNVALLDLASKQVEWLTRNDADSKAGGFSSSGGYITWTTNINGNQEIFLNDVSNKRTEQLKLPPGLNRLGGSDAAFSRDELRLLYYRDGPQAPNGLWVMNLASRESQPVTHALVGGICGEDMVEPRLVQFPSRDGKLTISAWVYVPYNQIKNGQVPAVVFLHDGPQAQATNSFNPAIQFLVNQGYFVIVPNYRGSTGYGKQFRDANRSDPGGGDLQDVLAAADWIVKTGYVDPKKLIVVGSGYGAYLTMMAVSRSPETWGAGIALFPFVDWSTAVRNEDPLQREYDRALLGDPGANQAPWQDRSPISFLDRIKAPLLLLAGGADPRCPKQELQQVADAVRKNSGKIQLKIYEDEGNGFAHLANEIDAWKHVAGFLKFNVPAPGCGQAACEVQ
jgi:dipeptidyl aminopeptidase/acylaminoacyl peptidase